MTKVVALAGGTGSAKILRGLAALDVDLTVLGNVGDDYRFYGLPVCPDLDIAMYTLAGVADNARGWGIGGDSFAALKQLSGLGLETWFRLGDMDMAVQVFRRSLIDSGMTLTEATDSLRRALGVSASILPVTDDPLETHIITPRGSLHLQEFWVRERGRPHVVGVEYRGSRSASLTREAKGAIRAADRVVVCPANPVTSIRPMLAVRGTLGALAKSQARISALSPMIGQAPVSGPAAKLMKACGVRVDSVGVAKLYSAFLDSIIIDGSDKEMKEEIESIGVECRLSSTFIRGSADEVRLARELLSA